MGATSFWLGLITTPRHKLERVNIEKLAKKHSIPVEWARYWYQVRMDSHD